MSINPIIRNGKTGEQLAKDHLKIINTICEHIDIDILISLAKCIDIDKDITKLKRNYILEKSKECFNYVIKNYPNIKDPTLMHNYYIACCRYHAYNNINNPIVECDNRLCFLCAEDDLIKEPDCDYY